MSSHGSHKLRPRCSAKPPAAYTRTERRCESASDRILTFDDLRRISRLGERAQLARVERWARMAKIRYQYDGNGGIWTTMDAMNAAVGLTSFEPDSRAPYHPDSVI